MSDVFERLQQELQGSPAGSGLTPSALLDLPDSLRELILWFMREATVGLPEVSAYLGQDEAATTAMLEQLAKQGFLRNIETRGERRYQLRMASQRKRERTLDLWSALEDEEGEGSAQ